MHGKPWRQRGFPRLFFWLQILAMLAYPGWLAWRFSAGQRSVELIGFTWVMGLLFYFPPVTIAVNLLVYSAGWSRPDRLEELWLTPLSSREVAFGAAFWGVVAGLILPASTILGVIVGVVADPARWLWPQYGTHYLGLVLLVVAVSATIASAALTVGHWYNFQTHRWRVPFVGALSTVCVGGWFLAGGFLLVLFFDDSFDVGEEALFLLVPAMMGVVAILGTVWNAGALAPTKFWSPVFRESAEELVIIWAGRPMRRNRALKKAARATLGTWVPRRLARQTAVLLCVALAMIDISALTGDFDASSGFSGFGDEFNISHFLARAWNMHSLTLFLTISMIVNAILEFRQRGDLAAVIVPGRLLASLLRRHAVAMFVFIVLFVLGGVYSVWMEGLRGDPLGLLFVGFSICVLVAMVAFSFLGLLAFILSRRRWRLRLAAWSVFVICSLLFYATKRSNSEFFWHISLESGFEPFFVLLPIWVAGSLALLAPQALHSRSISILRASGYEASPGRIERAARPERTAPPAPD